MTPYEFTQEENRGFDRLAQTMRQFAMIFGLFGLLNVVSGTRQLMVGQYAATSNVIHIIAGILVIVLAWFITRPLASFKRITTTEGNDIGVLMDALAELNSVHGLFSLVLLLIALAPVTGLLIKLLGYR